MYFVFMKVPGKVASMDSADPSSVVSCEYEVPERYVKPSQDLDLYLAIQKESQNGFNTIEEAQTWAKDAMKRIFKFIHSTPKVSKEYTKCYVKIVDEESLTESFMRAVNNGRWSLNDIPKAPLSTIAKAYPNYKKAYDGGEIHITMDMNLVLDEFKEDEREEMKKVHLANSKKPNFAKVWKKYSAPHHIDDDIFISYGYELEEAKKSKAKAIDNVPRFATYELLQDLGIKTQYFFAQRVGKWIEVRKMFLTDKSIGWGGKVEESRYGFEWQVDEKFGLFGRRWLASKHTIESIKKELCLDDDETIFDLTEIEPFYKIPDVNYIHTVVEMYRFLLCTGNIVECEKYKK